MKHRTPALFAIVVIVLMAANLRSTMRTESLQQQILERGIVRIQPQITSSEWSDGSGIRHRIETPRAPGQSSQDVQAIHADAVATFAAAFPPTK